MGSTTTAETWQRIGELFAVVSELDAQCRHAFLEEQCADALVRAEVLRLLSMSDRAGDFLETPAFKLNVLPGAPLLDDGEVISGRFVVRSLIGRGGMGEVYAAEDLELQEAVALKVMRPGVDEPFRMAERFRREVQLGRRVTHPAVCRLHDVVSHTSGNGMTHVVLTMELVQGETLASRITRERIPVPEALEIARQIAEGLDAAHACGVLHRDLKPANILLSQRSSGTTRAVLTDFGLARATAEPGSGVTRPGVVIGTPEYLAPELLLGCDAATRSDLYSFGLVLFELLTGRRPLDAALAARSVMAPRLRDLDSELPPAWDDIVARALSPDPQDRYSSASEITAALSTPPPPNRLRPVALRLATAALATVALLALSSWAFRFIKRQPPVIPPASQVLLTDMINATADSALDGATEVLRSQLSQSPHFELVTTASIRDALMRMRRRPTDLIGADVAREVALRQGASAVAYSTLTRLGSEYVLNVKVEHVGARPTFAQTTSSQEFRATSPAEVFSAIHQGASWIRSTVGERPADLQDQDRSPSETTTSSWEALRLFTKANATHAEGQPNDALLLLGQALHLDPEFATAHMRRGDLLMSLKRDAEGYAAWREAIRLMERQRLTSRESLRMRAQYLEDTGDLHGAETAFRSYALAYPNDFHAAFFLGSALAELGRTAEAAEWHRTAERLRPGSYVARVHLAKALIDQRQLDAVRPVLQKLRDDGHGDWVTWLEGVTAFSSGDMAGALRALEPLRASTDREWRSRASTLSASWLVEAKREDDAILELETGIVFDAAQGLLHRQADKWIHLAALRCGRNDVPACRAAAAKAMEVGANPQRAMLAGSVLARSGDIRAALGLLDTFRAHPDVPRVRAARLRLEGEIALARGAYGDAVAALTAAAALSPPRAGRLFLAHALGKKRDLEAAERLLREFVEHPVRVYYNPEPELPGQWREATRALRELSSTAVNPIAPHK